MHVSLLPPDGAANGPSRRQGAVWQVGPGSSACVLLPGEGKRGFTSGGMQSPLPAPP